VGYCNASRPDSHGPLPVAVPWLLGVPMSQKATVWLIMTGCVHEGWSTHNVKFDKDAARSSYENLAGKEPTTDRRLEGWQVRHGMKSRLVHEEQEDR